MLGQRRSNLTQLEFVCVEDLVPHDHILRRIDAVLDLKDFHETVRRVFVNRKLSQCDYRILSHPGMAHQA